MLNTSNINSLPGGEKKIQVTLISIILPVVVIFLLEKMNFVITFDVIVLYLYINIFIRSNTLALRIISKKYGGIYENLLCTGLSLRQIILLEVIVYIKKNFSKILIFNCSIITGYFIINLETMAINNFLWLLLLANALSFILNLIIASSTVTNSIINKSFAQVITIIGWITGLVIFFAKNSAIKFLVPIIVIFLLCSFSILNILIKKDYEVV